MPKFQGSLVRGEPIASGTWAFTFDLGGSEFSFRAGQTIDITLPDPPYQDAAGNRRTFSIASPPGREPLMVATRVRGSAFKKSLVEGAAGMRVEIEGPFGSFTLPQRPTEVVLLAGGIALYMLASILISDRRHR